MVANRGSAWPSSKNTYQGDEKCALLAGRIEFEDEYGDMLEYTANNIYTPVGAKLRNGK